METIVNLVVSGADKLPDLIEALLLLVGGVASVGVTLKIKEVAKPVERATAILEKIKALFPKKDA